MLSTFANSKTLQNNIRTCVLLFNRTNAGQMPVMGGRPRLWRVRTLDKHSFEDAQGLLRVSWINNLQRKNDLRPACPKCVRPFFSKCILETLFFKACMQQPACSLKSSKCLLFHVCHIVRTTCLWYFYLNAYSILIICFTPISFFIDYISLQILFCINHAKTFFDLKKIFSSCLII